MSIFSKNINIEVPEFQEKTLTVLHLSDVHFKNPGLDMSAKSTKKNFFAVLRDHKEAWKKHFHNEAPFDAIFIAGDISYQCGDKYFNAAREFISELLIETGVSGKRLYMVPGEHDVYLRFIKNTYDSFEFESAEILNDFLKSASRGSSQRISARFSVYQKFIQSVGRKHGSRIPSATTDFFYSDVFKNKDKKIAVLGLNSAWMCNCRVDKDKGMLAIGAYQIEKAYKTALKTNRSEPFDLVLGLMHHPIEWMKEDDEEAAAALSDKCQAVFRGHCHKGEDCILDGEQKTPIISCSSYAASDPVPSFCVSSFDLSKKKVHIWPYIWELEKKSFMPVSKLKGLENGSGFISRRIG